MARRPIDEQAAFDRLGKEIRKARGARTQAWLADAIDVDQTSLSGYELGKGRIPLIKLFRLEEACGLPLGELLHRSRIISIVRSEDQAPALEAIMTDPFLDEDGRDFLSHAYDFARRSTGDVVAEVEAAPRMRTDAEIEAAGRARGEQILAARRRKRS